MEYQQGTDTDADMDTESDQPGELLSSSRIVLTSCDENQDENRYENRFEGRFEYGFECVYTESENGVPWLWEIS